MIALSGILIGLPPLGHKYSFAPSLAFDKQGIVAKKKEKNTHIQQPIANRARKETKTNKDLYKFEAQTSKYC